MRLSLVISIEDTAFDAVAVRGAWQDGIRMAADAGYDAVELAVRDPRAVDAGRVLEAVRAVGLHVAAVGTGQAYLRDGLSLTSDDAGIRARAIERIAAHISLAGSLGALVVIGLVRGRVTGDRPTTEARFVAALEALLPPAERAGVRLVIEPINRYETDYLVSVDETLAVLDRVRSPQIGILADTFHMNIEEPSIEGSLRRCGPRLGHVHVADSNRQAPGRGHLNFASIISTLRAMGYRGYLSAEILPVPNPQEAARQSVEYLRAVLGTTDREGMG